MVLKSACKAAYSNFEYREHLLFVTSAPYFAELGALMEWAGIHRKERSGEDEKNEGRSKPTHSIKAPIV